MLLRISDILNSLIVASAHAELVDGSVIKAVVALLVIIFGNWMPNSHALPLAAAAVDTAVADTATPHCGTNWFILDAAIVLSLDCATIANRDNAILADRDIAILAIKGVVVVRTAL